MTGLQPIETAPTDGTEILVFVEENEDWHAGFWVAFYADGWNNHYDKISPKLWMPLPPSPIAKP